MIFMKVKTIKSALKTSVMNETGDRSKEKP